MKYTKNYNLNLPDFADQYNLKHWNENTEKIDDKLNEHQMKLDASTPETTPSSLMIRNEQGKVKVTTPLEQDDTNMAVNIDYLMNAFRIKMLDEAHPKGEVYYTEDKNFDPNVSWVGTWVRIKERFIWAMGDDGNAGDVGGSQSSSFTIGYDNLPPHQHYFSESHSHAENASSPTGSGDLKALGYNSSGSVRGSYINALSGYVGERIYTDSASVSGSTYYSGSGNYRKPANDAITYDKMPPYEKAYCWKRTE